MDRKTMNLRLCVMAVGLFVLLSLSVAGGGMAAAQQGADNQQQPSMTPVNGVVTMKPTVTKEMLIEELQLNVFVAAGGDLTSCAGDKGCLRHAMGIKSWVCIAGVCDGTDKTKKPLDCTKDIADQYPSNVQDEINSNFCPLIKSPGADTRKVLLAYVPEDSLVEYGAYLLALKGSAPACENYVKDYIGAYGPQWKSKWYRVMSGCRILAGASTRQLEEKNFYTWYGVTQGKGSCSDIFISEMRDACSASGATPPL
jgi:hypothetical protein